MPNLAELSEIAKRFLNPKMRVLYEADLIDKENELTDLGLEILQAMTLEDKLDELVQEAEKILQARKKRN